MPSDLTRSGQVLSRGTDCPFSQAETAATDSAADEMIVVTGSRIARPNLDSAVPISTITAQELRETGEVSLGDTLNLMPQFRPTYSTQNSGRFIGTAGISALDLRGMGTSRTLVLQNGRRIVGASQDGVVDLNLIPPSLVSLPVKLLLFVAADGWSLLASSLVRSFQ